MYDIIFYLKLISWVGFIFAGFFAVNAYKKIPTDIRKDVSTYFIVFSS